MYYSKSHFCKDKLLACTNAKEVKVNYDQLNVGM